MSESQEYANAIQAFEALPEAERKAFSKQVKGKGLLPLPDRTNGLYWAVIVTFCLALLICVGRISGVIDVSPDEGIKALSASTIADADKLKLIQSLLSDDDKVVGMFSTIVSFLAGIFIPSPVANGGDQK